jgi:hypothetical protein
MATQEMMTGSNFIICREFSQAVQGLHSFSAGNKKAIDAPHNSWHFRQINDGFEISQKHRARQVSHRQSNGSPHASAGDGCPHSRRKKR